MDRANGCLLPRLDLFCSCQCIAQEPVIDHHPLHLHGHTFWITGTEGGRMPEPSWYPSNNALVGVARAREVEFIANNPGDWIMHCHMFHHMMNHMVTQIGPRIRQKKNDPIPPNSSTPKNPHQHNA